MSFSIPFLPRFILFFLSLPSLILSADPVLPYTETDLYHSSWSANITIIEYNNDTTPLIPTDIHSTIVYEYIDKPYWTTSTKTGIGKGEQKLGGAEVYQTRYTITNCSYSPNLGGCMFSKYGVFPNGTCDFMSTGRFIDNPQSTLVTSHTTYLGATHACGVSREQICREWEQNTTWTGNTSLGSAYHVSYARRYLFHLTRDELIEVVYGEYYPRNESGAFIISQRTVYDMLQITEAPCHAYTLPETCQTIAMRWKDPISANTSGIVRITPSTCFSSSSSSSFMSSSSISSSTSSSVSITPGNGTGPGDIRSNSVSSTFAPELRGIALTLALLFMHNGRF